MAIITIKNVNIENIKKGRANYEQATVEYTDEKGDTKSKKVMSFAAPAVFDVIKKAKPGDVYNARSVEKDGYWNWAELTPVVQTATSNAKGGAYVDQRETADERRMRQLMIVRQSSLSNALEFLKLRGDNTASMEDVLSTAQDFVDFVYGTEDLVKVDSEDQDIPY